MLFESLGARETLEALGVSSVTRKSNTFTFGGGGAAGGGAGASGGLFTIVIALPGSVSEPSSTEACRGACGSVCFLPDFFEVFPLYRAPWYF